MDKYIEALSEVQTKRCISEKSFYALQELVKKHRLRQAKEEQYYHISKLVMKEIMTLLSTDGINSRKEVLRILETYKEAVPNENEIQN